MARVKKNRIGIYTTDWPTGRPSEMTQEKMWLIIALKEATRGFNK